MEWQDRFPRIYVCSMVVWLCWLHVQQASSTTSTTDHLLGISVVLNLPNQDENETFSESNSTLYLDTWTQVTTEAGKNVSEYEEDPCQYYPMEFIEEKIWVVGVFGTLTAVTGIGLNCVATYLLGRMMLRASPGLIYLFMLAILDVVFLACYILVFSVQIYFDYFASTFLYYAWNAYLVHIFALARVVQTASTYLIVVASIERLIDVVGATNQLSQCNPRKRLTVVASVLCMAVSLRIVTLWELQVHEKLECPEGFQRLQVDRTEMAKTFAYHMYSVYVINMIQVFIPFVLLIALNTLITLRIRMAMNRGEQIFRRRSAWEGEKQEQHVKTATKMLVAIVCSYIISNCLSVIVTLMEQFNREFLHQHMQMYTFAVDTVNLLYVITASTRILIYVAANVKIREQFCNIVCCLKKSRRLWQNDISSASTAVSTTVNGQPPSLKSEIVLHANGEHQVLQSERTDVGYTSSSSPVVVRHYFATQQRQMQKSRRAPIAKASEFSLSNCSTPMLYPVIMTDVELSAVVPNGHLLSFTEVQYYPTPQE